MTNSNTVASVSYTAGGKRKERERENRSIRNYLVEKKIHRGAPGWFSCLSVRLLVSAQVMISRS